MANERRELLSAIERDREEIIELLRGFIRAKSPNPPGDTTGAVAQIREFLARKRLEHRIIAPEPKAPNVVASFDGSAPGRHLVLNGHIDTFPVVDDHGWTQDPWGGALIDGKIFGRGASDMKSGTASCILTYYYLHNIRQKLKGKLTLTCVSEEITSGPCGARYLIEHHPEVLGDCLLSAENGGPNTIRFGWKGALQLAFTIRTRGGYAAYTHVASSAASIGLRLIADLNTLTETPSNTPEIVARAIEQATQAYNEALGHGAAHIAQKVTVSIGVVKAGVVVNLVPDRCRIEADIRLPLGVDEETMMIQVRKILANYPEASVEKIKYAASVWSDPYGEMVEIIRSNAKAITNVEPVPILSLGACDARLWSYLNIPAYIYGVPDRGTGSTDEYVKVEDFLNVLRTHVLSAYDYLSRG